METVKNAGLLERPDYPWRNGYRVQIAQLIKIKELEEEELK